METVETKLKAWLEHMRPQIERSTMIGYERAVAHTLTPVFGNTPIAELKVDDIQKWIDGLTITTKRINNMLTPLRGVSSQARSGM